MRKFIFWAILLAFFGVLFRVALGADVEREKQNILDQRQDLIVELEKIESRFMDRLLTLSSAIGGEDIETQISFVNASSTRSERKERFKKLVQSFNNSSASNIDVNNQAQRSALDELMGLLNRLKILEPRIDELTADCEAFNKSWSAKSLDVVIECS
jgi:hypothetical protein